MTQTTETANKAKEIIEAVSDVMATHYKQLCALVERGEVIGFHICAELTDGSISSGYVGAPNILIGLLEISKHKMLSERRDYWTNETANDRKPKPSEEQP